MTTRNTLLPALILAILVLWLHLTALTYHLYFHNWWFHMIIHVLIGLVLSLITLFIYDRVVQNYSKRFPILAAIALPLVLFFAISWEVFELWSGLIYVSGPGYTLDTAKGIFTGIAGGMIGVGYVFIVLKRSPREVKAAENESTAPLK